jgi:phosphoesterase RecJ-like protein
MTSPTTIQPRYDEVARFITAHKRFLLTGHVRADGDCLGAEVALYHLLKELGKEAFVVNPDPIAPRYVFLAKETPLSHWNPGLADGGVPNCDVACVLDVAVLSRTGPLLERIRAAKMKTLVVDHHQPGDGESWDCELIDSAAPASGALVYRLAKKMGIVLPKPALEAVFVSITTDTGWFKYSNTDRETFEIASELTAAGVEPSRVYNRLFQTNPADYPIGIGVAMRSLQYAAGGKLAIATLRARDLEAAGAQLSETDDVLDLLRSVDKVEVVLLFREVQSGRAKCSARSKGSLDVNELMRRFGGGGHKKAAGADLPGPFEDSVARVAAAAAEALEKPQR